MRLNQETPANEDCEPLSWLVMESLRQEQQRWAAMTAEQRAREDWSAEQQHQSLMRSEAQRPADFSAALLAAQEAAAKEDAKTRQRAVIESVAATLGATVESIEEVGHE